MELHLSEGRIPVGYARFGSIWKKGEVTETDFRLRNEAGEEVPVQSKAAAFWPDGSIKWAFHEADSARMGKQVRLTCHGEKAVNGSRMAAYLSGAFCGNSQKRRCFVPKFKAAWKMQGGRGIFTADSGKTF